MPACDIDQGLAIADKLRTSIDERCSKAFSDITTLRVTVSVGVATLPDGEGVLADLVDQADKALYQAKSSGRNRVEAFAPPRQTKASRAKRTA
jgi:diguanylate cyclase (GGDEF)-like protein